MIRTGSKIAIEVVIGVIALAALLVGAAAWRLSTGPVELGFLTPRIEAALSDPEAGVFVRIGTTEAVWGGAARTLDLHAREVRVVDPDGAITASFNDAILSLSLRALAQGTIAPSVIEVVGARLRVIRQRDGTFSIGPSPDQPSAVVEDDDLSQVVPAVMAQLLSRPAGGEPLSFLTAVSVRNGSLRLSDYKLGKTWFAPYADITLRREAGGLSGEIDLALEAGERPATLAVSVFYSPTAETIDVDADFADVQPAAVAALIPEVPLLAGFAVPLAGTLTGTFRDDGQVETATFDLSGVEGLLTLPEMLEAPLAVRELALVGRIAEAGRLVELETASLALGAEGGPRVEATAGLRATEEGLQGDLAVDAAVTLNDVAVETLPAYWPPAIAKDVRKWVTENLTAGTVEELTAQVQLARAADASEIDVKDLAGSIRYRDLEIHYLRPMPPVEGVAGSARFDDERIAFTPTRGHVGNLVVDGGEVTIAPSDSGRETMTIDLALAGPLGEVFHLLDHDRLKLVRRLGLDVSGAAGQAAARLAMTFPLLSDLTFDQVAVSANARVDGLTLSNFVLGHDLTAGDLALAVDKNGMRVDGTVALADIPVQIDWTERFDGGAPERTQLEVQVARLDDAQRKRLGLDLGSVLQGPVSAVLTAALGRSGDGSVQAAVNLAEARLALTPLEWAKAAGRPAALYATVDLRNMRPTTVTNLDLQTASLTAKGQATFAPSGTALRSLALSELAYGRTALRDVSVTLPGATTGARIAMGAGTLDATPWLEDDDAGRDPEAGAAGAATLRVPLQISARGLARVYTSADGYLEQVDLGLVRSARGWEKIEVSGRVPEAFWRASPAGGEAAAAAAATATRRKTVRVSFGPVDSDAKTLSVTAEDMGAVLRALDVLDTVVGGRLSVSGRSGGPLPGATLTARIEANDYVLVRAPAMAKLLTVASLTGLNDLLKGQGIRFQRLTGDITLKKGVLRTDLVRAYGPALGLTAKGSIDFNADLFDLEGTIVPAYTVNRILGEIPLLGPLLTGGEGEGLFAATYRLTGPLSNPTASVNPLAALAPGFLRSLFSGADGPAEADGDAQRPPVRRHEP